MPIEDRVETEPQSFADQESTHSYPMIECFQLFIIQFLLIWSDSQMFFESIKS